MKIQTCEAARTLGIHPSHLFQHIVELAPQLTFHDVWPEIDQGWVETVSAAGHHHIAHVEEDPLVVKESMGSDLARRLSQASLRVLDKLARQKKWGSVSVSFEALLNLTRVPKRDLEHAVAELRKEGLLDQDGTGRGCISLNSSKKDQIEEIAEQEWS